MSHGMGGGWRYKHKNKIEHGKDIEKDDPWEGGQLMEFFILILIHIHGFDPEQAAKNKVYKSSLKIGVASLVADKISLNLDHLAGIQFHRHLMDRVHHHIIMMMMGFMRRRRRSL